MNGDASTVGPVETKARAAFSGLRWALDRLDHAITSQDVDGTFVAATEAVVWASALDESLWFVDGYEALRQSDPEGASIPGLRLSRNLGAHKLVQPHSWRTGAQFPLSFPFRFFGVEWARLESLPEPRSSKRLPEQVESYRSYLEGRDVDVTLRSALRFFARCPLLGGSTPSGQSFRAGSSEPEEDR